MIFVHVLILDHTYTFFYLRIDKGPPGGALYLGICIHGYGSYNGILYKF